MLAHSLAPSLFQSVIQIYPTELQLEKANSNDTEAPFSDLQLLISNGFFSSKINDKREGFDFDIVNFPFFDGDVPRTPSYGVSQRIRFARVSSHFAASDAGDKAAKFLK